MTKPTQENEPFLSRWARRKRDASTGIEVDAPEGVAQDETAIDGGGTPQTEVRADDEDTINLDDLPRVEDLDESSDVRAFLDRRVPAALRNAALARMWTLDPTIRDFIEVAENQWNWNVPGGAPYYEEIAGNIEIAERIVQGGGATLPVIQSVPVDAAPHTLVENGLDAATTSQQSDGTPIRSVALQQNPAEANEEPHAHKDASAPHMQPEGAATCVDAAARHEGVRDDEETAVRRRHGGALPV